MFGVTSAMTFFYFPPVKVWGHPLISYRMPPRSMLGKIEKRLGIQFASRTYRSEDKAMEDLDARIAEGHPVGLQASVSYLTYIIPEFRVYFNSHMLLIFGKEGDEYLVSDTVVDRPMRIKDEDLRKARFAKGQNAPDGFMFYPTRIPEAIDYRSAIKKAVKSSVSMMLQPMLPIVGINAIYTLSRKIDRLNRQQDRKHARSFMGNMLMFQEEMGTGGAGFRYLYAAFLQESAELLDLPGLDQAKRKMIEAADLMRRIAGMCATILKGKRTDFDLAPIVELVREWARTEREAYTVLKTIKWK